MSDAVSPEIRSKMMSRIRSKHTTPERIVRKALFAAGFRFRLHRRDLPGIPDIVLPGLKVAIFVNGCFWHMHRRCKFAKLPSSRHEFWLEKLARNAERDKEKINAMVGLGWRVLVVWECATRDKSVLRFLPSLLSAWIAGEETIGELYGGQISG